MILFRFARGFSLPGLPLHLEMSSTFLLGSEVLTAASTKMAVFWVVAPCRLVEVYQRFRGPCCLHHQGNDYSSRLHGATTQKTTIFVIFLLFFLAPYPDSTIDIA
jgi:hypothetical protein